MTDKVRVAALQMVSTKDVESNIETAGALIRRASDHGVQLAVLPEYFPIIGDNEKEKLKFQEEFGNGPFQKFLAASARDSGIWLVAGSIPLSTEDWNRVSNSCLLFSPDGECIARYDKIHLFDVYVGDNESYNESNTMVAGEDIVVARLPFGNIGMSICYDLRFPELYRSMIENDVIIITVPSAFTESTGRKHWEILLKARAVENLCFIVASNQGGHHSEKRRTWGHSMIIDPWGDILSSMEMGPGMIYADLDLVSQRNLRASFPALKHIRLLKSC